MLQVPAGVRVLNTEHVLMTIEPGGRVEMELTVKEGVGYVPASREGAEDMPVDLLPIDAIYSPVRRVNFRVTNARVEQRTDYDRLTLEVWTNGAVDPETAVSIAAKILREQLKVFVGFEEDEEAEDYEPSEVVAISGAALNEKIGRAHV